MLYIIFALIIISIGGILFFTNQKTPGGKGRPADVQPPRAGDVLEHTGGGSPDRVLSLFEKTSALGAAATAGVTGTRRNLHELYSTIGEALLAGAGHLALLPRRRPGGGGRVPRGPRPPVGHARRHRAAATRGGGMHPTPRVSITVHYDMTVIQGGSI